MNVNLAFIFLVCFATAIRCTDIEVKLKLGSVVGFKEKINEQEVNVFLGIPYAIPPLRHLRFRKPQPVTEKWSSPLLAKSWPNICMQDKYFFEYYSDVSEDCLYLNVWTPINLNEDYSQGLKPVMVFIHGGGYSCMGTSYKHYNASRLSSFGDVVVVSMNYRLGSFGFFFGDSDEAPGNVGLYDQALALEWVQENIAYFGGDPNKVTLFGESAGAWSTSLHFLSPVSQDSFHKAIIMSGAAYSNIGVESKQVALQKSLKFAQMLGCAAVDDQKEVTREQLSCLREADVTKIVAAQNSPELIRMSKSFIPIAFFPIFEEAFIPKSPQKMINEAVFNKGVDVLVGIVSNEGNTMHFGLQMMSLVPQTDDYEQLLRSFVKNLFSNTPDSDSNAIIEHYLKDIGDTKSEAAKLSYYSALGDVIFNCDALSFARKVSQVNDVYQYLFKYGIEDLSDGVSPVCETPDDACHANELPITFGTASGVKDQEVSKRWMKLVTDFAKTGTVPWQKHGEKSPYYIFTGNQSTDELSDNYRGDACKLWKPLLQNL